MLPPYGNNRLRIESESPKRRCGQQELPLARNLGKKTPENYCQQSPVVTISPIGSLEGLQMPDSLIFMRVCQAEMEVNRFGHEEPLLRLNAISCAVGRELSLASTPKVCGALDPH